MTHPAFEDQDKHRLKDIVAADETNPGLIRQVVNGLGGLFVLLATGLVVVLVVLWKAR